MVFHGQQRMTRWRETGSVRFSLRHVFSIFEKHCSKQMRIWKECSSGTLYLVFGVSMMSAPAGDAVTQTSAVSLLFLLDPVYTLPKHVASW